LKGLMIAVISFICRPSVVCHCRARGPARVNYQEAGQLSGLAQRFELKWFLANFAHVGGARPGGVFA
jgi:hypothetical protein